MRSLPAAPPGRRRLECAGARSAGRPPFSSREGSRARAGVPLLAEGGGCGSREPFVQQVPSPPGACSPAVGEPRCESGAPGGDASWAPRARRPGLATLKAAPFASRPTPNPPLPGGACLAGQRVPPFASTPNALRRPPTPLPLISLTQEVGGGDHVGLFLLVPPLNFYMLVSNPLLMELQ